MNQRILIVDDEPQICEVFGLFLEQKGFGISSAGTAKDCLARVQSDNPDLVVLDINLAEDDGLQLLTKIKEMKPDIRVVMMTGLGFDDQLLREALQRGADGYVAKAMPTEELINTVKRVLP